MGRKSLAKSRKNNDGYTDEWVHDLLPKLQNEDLKKLSINDLAQLMGKSKSTLYEYYSSKEDIYKHVVTERLTLVQDSVDMNLDTDDIVLTFESFMIQICRGLEGITARFLGELKMHYPDIWELIESFLQLIISFFTSLYKAGIQTGVFVNYPISLMIALDKTFMQELVTDESIHQGNIDQLVKQYMGLRLDGLRKV